MASGERSILSKDSSSSLAGYSVDLICGGFPCQPTSQAAARSKRGDGWLWPEFAEVVDILRPGFVLVENPEALRYKNRGLGEVLGDLAEMGYNAEWKVLPASIFGAPHRRARVWVVAYSYNQSEPDLSVHDEASVLSEFRETVRSWPDPPEDLRMDDGVSGRMDRLRALGNSAVPQTPEWIGRRISDQ